MPEPSLIALRVVREVALAGSFSAAAERLGYTQSAVSRQVAQAERTIGSRLFDRHARGATLTPAGRILVRHATVALAELQAATIAVEELARQRPRRVRLGAFSTAMAVLVPRAVAVLRARDQRQEVLLTEGTSERLAARVAAGKIEIALVTASAGAPEGVVFDALIEDRLLVAMPHGHRLAGQGPVDPELLRDEVWIAGSSDPDSTLLGAWTRGRWLPRVAYEVRDWNAKLGLVAAGLGITVVPRLSVSALPGEIHVEAIDHPGATRSVALARRAEVEPDPLVQSLTGVLREVAERLR